MKTLRAGLALAAIAAMASGCSGSPSSGQPAIHSVNPLSTGKLQFAVGTANLYGTGTGLNVVSTYRQSGGASNVLLNTPVIKGPFALPPAAADSGAGIDAYSTLPNGPSIEETTAGGTISGTSQTVPLGSPACDQTTPCTETSATGGTVTIQPNTSTFGQAGGVFTDGISPGNSTTSGSAASYVPYTEPMYDTTSGNAFTPFGGPPEFPGAHGIGLRDGDESLGSGVLGFPLGFNTFAGVTPAAGTYNLTLTVPTGFSGSQATYATTSAMATLASTSLLGTITAPALTLDGNGGGSFTVASLPAGVTEELVMITDLGITAGKETDSAVNCQGPLGATTDTNGDQGAGKDGAGPVYYTILVKAPGTFTLPDSIGPNTDVSNGANTIVPSESICTASANQTSTSDSTAPGDTYFVQAIGVDYPMVESLFPANTSQTPALTGANGQSDITISAVGTQITSDAYVRAYLRHLQTRSPFQWKRAIQQSRMVR